MDWKLELVPIPVSDVDRAKAFYAEKAGFNEDLDHSAGDDFRVVQLTPPGSACSIAIGTGIVDTPPGSVQGLHLVVSDINAARAELTDRGVDVGEVQDLGGGPVRPLQGPGRQRLDLAAAALLVSRARQEPGRSSLRTTRYAGTGQDRAVLGRRPTRVVTRPGPPITRIQPSPRAEDG